MVVLLELIIVLERRGRHINHSKITIGFDNRKHYQNIVNELHKSNNYVIEAGSKVVEIKKEIEEIKF